jgi:hypothetical protein
MAASSATIGYGAILKKGATAIAEVVSISGPGLSRDTTEVTHLTSDDNAKEFIGGMVDGGEVSFEINYLPGNTTHQTLITDLYTTGAATYTIVLTDGSSSEWTFSAIVTGFELNGLETSGKISANVSMKVTGKPTFPS